MDPADLEREMHARLRRVPAPRAPASLRMRVMAAVAASGSRPWYLRPWFTWPTAMQTVGGVTACIGMVAAMVWGPLVSEQAGLIGVGLSQNLVSVVHPEWPAPLEHAVEWLDAAHVIWRVFLGPAVFYTSAFVVVVGSVFALGATLLTQSTIRRTAV